VKTLNFYPYYEDYLSSRRKTTTFRIHAPDYEHGDIVQLTLGWSEDVVQPLHKVEITSVYSKPISSLRDEDFDGESPDCEAPEPTALVLSAIYRQVVRVDHVVWVVKFKHLSF
jgi:hypothetical protein